MNETVERIVRANPVPGVTLADDEFVDSAALFSSIVSRRNGMADTRVDKWGSEVAVQTAWYRHPALVAVSAALAVVVVIGATALLFGGAEGPTAGTPPAATPPPTTEAAPTTSTTVIETTTTAVPELTAAGLVSVERVIDESLYGSGMRIWSLAVGGPGIVAVGEVVTPDDVDSVWGGSSMDAVVLVSADGRSWDRVDDPELFGGDDWDQLHAIWSSPSGLIAEGRDAEAPYADVVWYASDDGITWALITDEDLYNAWERQWRSGEAGIEFFGGGPGWVAVIDRDGFAEPQEVLVSSDGLEWETTTEPLESLVEPRPEAPSTPGPDAWGSGDSGYWWSMAWDEAQVVAVRYHEQPKVGVSTDGGDTWLQVDPEAFGDDRLLITIDVVKFGDYYIIAGNTAANAEVWILEWSEQEDT